MLMRTQATGIRNCRHRIVGAYVVSIQGRSAFTVEQANLALTIAFDAIAAADSIEFVFSPKSHSDAFDFRRLLKLSQVKRIRPLRTVIAEGVLRLRLCLLLSLRLGTRMWRTLMPMCQ
jgi:hypothetical protein